MQKKILLNKILFIVKSAFAIYLKSTFEIAALFELVENFPVIFLLLFYKINFFMLKRK